MNTPALTIERQETLDEIVEGVINLIKKYLKAPVIKSILESGIKSFHERTKEPNTTEEEIGEISLLTLNAFRAVVNKPQKTNPESPSPSQIALDNVKTTMDSVHTWLKKPMPIRQIYRLAIMEIVKKCERLVDAHNITPDEIEEIGIRTWQKVKEEILGQEIQ